MNDSLFSTKDIVKYLIVAGLIYSILKMIPAQKIDDKDLILILAIITIGFITVDCVILKTTTIKKEGFAQESNPFAVDLNIDIDALLKKKAEMQAALQAPKVPVSPTVPVSSPKVPVSPTVPVSSPKVPVSPTVPVASPKSMQMVDRPIKDTIAQAVKEIIKPAPKVAQEIPKVSCAMEVGKVKKELENEINKLKVQLNTRVSTTGPDGKIASKYFEALLTDLNEKGLLDARDIENIQIKMRSKLLTIDEVINSLEMLKKEGKSRVRNVEGKVKDDRVYNELPSDFYSPLGDKIANEWDNEYTILNTNKWQVPMPRPPVCINTTPCKVCPSDASNYPVNLKQWDDSRYVTQSKINKKWADDQART